MHRVTKWQYFFLSLVLIQVLHAAIDNTGTEFIICYMDNYQTPNSSNYDLELFITTSSNDEAFINVTTPLYNSSWLWQTSVTRGDIATVLLPPEIRGSGTSTEDLGVYITSSEEVTVYSVNKQLYSTDAFTAYPTDSLGSEYIAVTWEGFSQIMVVATEEGTTTIDFNFPLTYNTSDIYYSFQLYDGGDTLSVTLEQFQTFHIRSWQGDLTGTKIIGSANFAAFSGNYKVAVEDSPNTEQTSDHLVEQLVPTQAWGKEFITFPSPERTIGDYLKITAAEDATNYFLDGDTYTLNAQEFMLHRLLSDTYYWILSFKAISVTLFSKNIGVTGFNDGPNGGDPAMAVIVPIPLYGYDYTWSTVHTTEGAFTSNWIVIVTQANYTSGLVLDNAPIPDDVLWTDVIGGVYVGAKISVSDGSHSIYNTDPTQTFFGIAYGNALFNSYAYASGLRLTSINLPCSNTSTTAGDGEDNDCDGWIDEETANGIDDDGDGLIDEDLAAEPRTDGNWGEWGSWGACSATCGSLSGTYTRSRSCDNPAPANNGLYCDGDATETDVCTGTADECPGTDGQWSAWNDWTTCTVTCGTGTQSRDRSCDNPAPENGGQNCTGDSLESQNCTVSDYCLPSFYGNTLLGCGNSSFGCGTGTVDCIDIELRCDGTVDCEDGTDESEYFTGCDVSMCSSRNGAEILKGGMMAAGVAIFVWIGIRALE